jgi:hypothetical protein
MKKRMLCSALWIVCLTMSVMANEPENSSARAARHAAGYRRRCRVPRGRDGGWVNGQVLRANGGMV